MKKVLIVTYYWPPAGGPGVQRVLKFVKYLPKFGWQPLILTVANGEYPAIDKSLEKNIPSECKIFKTSSLEPMALYKRFMGLDKNANIPTAVLADSNPSFKKRFANWVRLNIFVPDAKIGWKRFAVKEGLEIIKNEKPDLIFSSSPPPTVHLIASELAKRRNLKWIADFRDPWTDIHYYEDQPRLSFVKALDKKYEHRALNQADIVTCISQLDIELDFAKKTDVAKCINIPNGYDEDDFVSIDTSNSSTEKFTILHLGAVNKERNPVKFFKAVNSLREKGAITKQNFQITFVGKVESIIKDTVEQNNISELVNYVDYLPHSKALKQIEKANALLLLVTQSQKNRRILPGKTFEYMRTGKYILALGPEDGEVSRIITETKTGKVIEYSDEAKMEETLETLITAWQDKQYITNDNAETIKNYSREELTKKLVRIFNNLIE